MNDTFFVGNYEKDTNIVIVRFINNFAVSKDKNIYSMGSVTLVEESSKSISSKVWVIVDISTISFLTNKIIKDMVEKIKKTQMRHVEGWVAVVSTTSQRLKLKILFALTGKKYPVVTNITEAREIIKGWQKERGVFPGK